MNDILIAFQMALLSGGKTAIKYKTKKEAKIAFPKIVKELNDYVNSKEYKQLILNEWDESKNKQPNQHNN